MLLIILIVVSLYFLIKKGKRLQDSEIETRLSTIIALAVLIEFLLLIYALNRQIPGFIIGLTLYLIIVYVFGVRNYQKLKLKELEFTSSKVNDEITCIYVADFQHDKAVDSYNQAAMENVVNKINQLEYDVLLLGGDYVNYQNHIDQFFDNLLQIKNRNHVYGVMGNHDYPFIPELEANFQKNNIHILNNDFEEVTINNSKITISGVEDLWTKSPNYYAIKERLNEKNYHINLTHNPDYITSFANENYDLSLAGHYHAGQVNFLPKLPQVRLVSKYVYGLFKFEQGSLFVTSGVGGSFFRGKISRYARWNTRPEVVKITIKPHKKNTV